MSLVDICAILETRIRIPQTHDWTHMVNLGRLPTLSLKSADAWMRRAYETPGATGPHRPRQRRSTTLANLKFPQIAEPTRNHKIGRAHV